MQFPKSYAPEKANFVKYWLNTASVLKVQRMFWKRILKIQLFWL